MLRKRIPPGFIEPCLPSSAKAPPSGPGWIHEIKHDGFRIVAHRDESGVRLWTRNGNDFTSRFPRVADAIGALQVKSCIIDGEAIVTDADAAERPPTTDSMADDRRDRFGPIASLRSADEQRAFLPSDHREIGHRLADCGRRRLSARSAIRAGQLARRRRRTRQRTDRATSRRRWRATSALGQQRKRHRLTRSPRPLRWARRAR
jgi:hypothetical protein